MNRIQPRRGIALATAVAFVVSGLGLVDAGPAQAAPAWWTAYPGVTGTVNVIAVDSLGRTYIGGNFSSVDGMPASDIAMWDGARWNTLAGGVTSPNVSEVRDIAFDNVGNVYVGGAFAGAGGVSSRNIIMWNGTSWQAMGAGTDLSSGPFDLLWHPTYGLLMGGDFTITVSGTTWYNLAQWQSGAWGRIGGTFANGTVRAMAVLSTGDLVITGDFSGTPNSCMTYARWNGTTWNCFAEITSGAASSLVADNSGNLYAGGDFTQTFPSSTPMRHVAKWNGSAWTEMGAVSTGLIAGPSELAWIGGTLTAGMSILRISGFSYTQAGAVQQWNGSGWTSLGGEFDNGVLALAATPSGGVLAGGLFTSNNSVPVNRLARWGEADPTTAPGAPVLTGATPAGTSATVSYTADDTGGAAITRMEFALDDTLTVDDSTTQVNGTRIITNLQSGTTYKVYARAVNYQGAGDWSLPLTFTTLRKPGAPVINSVTAGQTSATVNYTADDTGGAAITRMEFALDDTVTVDDSTTQVTGSWTISNLQSETAYTVYARAVNSQGPGPWSTATAFATQSAGPPPTPAPPLVSSPPRDVNATPGKGSVTATWSVPASSGSFPVTSYSATASPGGSSCLTSTTTCQITGLTAGVTYTVTVRALTGAGWSADSAPSNAVTLPRDSSPAITITGSRGSGSDARTIRVQGTTTNIDERLVTVWMTVEAKRSSRSSAEVKVRADGSFTWSRRTNRALVIFAEASGVRSNTISIRALGMRS